MMPPLSATSRIMKIGLSSDDLNLIEMSSISYWKIRQRLLRVPGVAAVDIYGERLQQRHVQVDPAKLARYGVSAPAGDGRPAPTPSMPGCCQYTEGFVVGTGGFVEAGGRRLNISNVQPIVEPEELGAGARRRARAASTLRLADVGTVLEDHMPLWGEGVVNDGAGLLLIVQKFRGANTMEVTRGRRGRGRRDAPRAPGHRDRHHDLPAGHVHRAVDRQPHHGAADRRRCS